MIRFLLLVVLTSCNMEMGLETGQNLGRHLVRKLMCDIQEKRAPRVASGSNGEEEWLIAEKCSKKPLLNRMNNKRVGNKIILKHMY